MVVLSSTLNGLFSCLLLLLYLDWEWQRYFPGPARVHERLSSNEPPSSNSKLNPNSNPGTQQVGKNFNPEAADFNLEGVFSLGLHNLAEFIGDLSTNANKELGIEQVIVGCDVHSPISEPASMVDISNVRAVIGWTNSANHSTIKSTDSISFP